MVCCWDLWLLKTVWILIHVWPKGNNTLLILFPSSLYSLLQMWIVYSYHHYLNTLLLGCTFRKKCVRKLRRNRNFFGIPIGKPKVPMFPMQSFPKIFFRIIFGNRKSRNILPIFLKCAYFLHVWRLFWQQKYSIYPIKNLHSKWQKYTSNWKNYSLLFGNIKFFIYCIAAQAFW
jgi:hypothetical protein